VAGVAGRITRFDLPSCSAAVLNRVNASGAAQRQTQGVA
jgi:hypothetical protein